MHLAVEPLAFEGLVESPVFVLDVHLRRQIRQREVMRGVAGRNHLCHVRHLDHLPHEPVDSENEAILKSRRFRVFWAVS